MRDNDFWLGVTVEAKASGASGPAARDAAVAVVKGVMAGL
ncbi:hypothetical protein [Alloactinosynnema sp. L-07]|nr:hypothetical protein [Alloactinosynnema sp. L-07]